MARMDLPARLEELGVNIGHIEPASSHNPRGNLVECRRIRTVEDSDELVDMVDERLRANGWPSTVILDISEWMQEIADNREKYAGAPGYLCAQEFSHIGRMQFTIGDAGVGIPRNIPASDDCTSIQLAMQEGRTSSGDPHRGIGFTHMRTYAQRIGGRLHVRSGAGAVTVDPAQGTEQPLRCAPLQGTIVCADIPVGNW
ncbi:MAG: ATP-binding protein [Nitriliruptoraceae bacterium]